MNSLENKNANSVNPIKEQNKKEAAESTNFIHSQIDAELEQDHSRKIHTRFPPEPNGYLHIGHAKSICLNFGTALKYQGLCNLRFDDTNPVKEDTEYIDSIMEDVKWLGFDWEDRLHYTSDYFHILYENAVHLIKEGLAFVCELNQEEMRKYRGTLTQPGTPSPYRDRPIEENLRLFEEMKAGKYPDGAMVLRAKIDMASPNIVMRDPVIYRIQHENHHRTGDEWCIYPMYDYAHPLSDAIENITHSICTLEFENNRPLYDWMIEHSILESRPRQIEFARLGLTYTVMSKRKLRRLVEEGYVTGWDDPRMPTISGLRRRGYTPASIRDFCQKIGVAKANSMVDIALLEHCIREDLNYNAPRAMTVLRPVKLVITNYPEGKTEMLTGDINPERPEDGQKEIPFSREIYIEQDDVMAEPVPKFFRLYPGNEARLKYAYIIKCEEVITDEAGNITEVRCTYDPTSKSGGETANRKVKSTLHWVDCGTCKPVEVRLYDHLFTKENPDDTEEGQDFTDFVNKDSLTVLTNAVTEQWVAQEPKESYQFLRQGYFALDPNSTNDKLVFNRVVSLKDTWAKIQKRN